MGNMCDKKICEPEMVTKPDTDQQSDGNYSNILPNNNVLGELLLPWVECLHLGSADTVMNTLTTEKQ